MNDAISNLGGGGLSTPYLANLANALNYTMSCLLTLFGGPIINKVGIKWACVIAAFGMPLGGSGYYTRARLGIDWYLLLARVSLHLGGADFSVSAVLLAASSMSARVLLCSPTPSRTTAVSIWGSGVRCAILEVSWVSAAACPLHSRCELGLSFILGGAINFATNFSSSTAGGIAWSTYLIFIGFECTGVIWAFLLSPTAKVRRKNGTRIPSSPPLSWKKEFIALYQHAKSPRVRALYLAVPAELTCRPGSCSSPHFIPSSVAEPSEPTSHSTFPFAPGLFRPSSSVSTLASNESLADLQPPLPSPSLSPTANSSSTAPAGRKRSARGFVLLLGSSLRAPLSCGSRFRLLSSKPL